MKSQRLRVFTQLEEIKYNKLSKIIDEDFTIKKYAFQIVCPFDENHKGHLTGNSLFCLKSLFYNKYWAIT